MDMRCREWPAESGVGGRRCAGGEEAMVLAAGAEQEEGDKTGTKARGGHGAVGLIILEELN